MTDAQTEPTAPYYVSRGEYFHTHLFAFSGEAAVRRHLHEAHGVEPADDARGRAGQHLDAHEIPRDAKLSYRRLALEESADRMAPTLPPAALASEVAGTSLRQLAEVGTTASASVQRLATATREARAQRERDAFWNHPESVTP
jgi:hypothetical protein